MILTISNSEIKVDINLIGAEICSLKSHNTNIEYCWGGVKKIWGSTAPVLFPIIGALKDGYYLYEGKKYQVSKHGFIRNNNDLKILHHSTDELRIGYQFSEETKLQYPFEFDFQITFQLNGSKLLVMHKVFNLSVTKSMYFSLGGHPAFNCPFNKNEHYDDYFLEFEKKETLNRWKVTKDGLLGTDSELFMENSSCIHLTHDLFQDDALVFKKINSRKVHLKSNKSPNFLTIDYPDFNYLGIWAKPDGDFVCVEPWLGVTDAENTNHDFKTKDGIIEITPEVVYNASFSIEINE